MSRLEQIQSWVKETPEDPFLHFALAKEFEKLSQKDKALEQYKHLVSAHPDYVGTYYHLGKLLEQAGELEEALQVYQSGIQVARKAGDQHAMGELAGAKLNLEDE